MDANSHSLNWFEIPVSDLARAKTFYETIFDITLGEYDLQGTQMATFPSGEGKFVNGALAKGPFHKPGDGGAVVYLNANPSIDAVVGRIAEAGGRVLLPTTSIGPIGFMALFADIEGNVVGLHGNALSLCKYD